MTSRIKTVDDAVALLNRGYILLRPVSISQPAEFVNRNALTSSGGYLDIPDMETFEQYEHVQTVSGAEEYGIISDDDALQFGLYLGIVMAESKSEVEPETQRSARDEIETIVKSRYITAADDSDDLSFVSYLLDKIYQWDRYVLLRARNPDKDIDITTSLRVKD